MKQIFLVLFLFPLCMQAQQPGKTANARYTISGYIRDSLNGESLLGATVSVIGKTKGITSNQFGFYSITLTEGRYQVICSYIGFQPKIMEVELNRDRQINFYVMPRTVLSEAVIVSSKKRDANVKNAQMGRFNLPIEQIKALPAFLGEVDLLKTIQLLPGVRNAGEGSSGIYVRGGGPDQNLILLDDAPVYNTGHLFGFFSIFNSDAIKNVTLIKGGMPAQYGGRLSSVLDVTMKEGNNQKFEVDAGIGIIASRLSIQGPIKKNKASFILSGRRTYIDAFSKLFVKKSSQFYGSGYYFYDLNAKVNYRLSEKDRIYLSGSFGRDVFDFSNGQQSLKINIPWGNSTGTFMGNHAINRK